LRKQRERAVSGVAPKADVRERAAALQLRCVAINPRHLSLIELEADDCRYPYGGDAEGEPITFLRPSAPRRLELLRLAFPSDQRARTGARARAGKGGATARGGGMSAEADPMLSRLKRLPARLRIAHVAALLRHERNAVALAHMGGFLSLPPRAKRAVGRVDASRRQASGWGEFSQNAAPHPGLSSASAFPPRRSAGGGVGECATEYGRPAPRQVFSQRTAELSALLRALLAVATRDGRG
jgi:hypothetical protein